MGQTLTNGVYLPDEGERNCYDGLASNWSILDGAVGTVAEHTSALSGKAGLSANNTFSGDNSFSKTLNINNANMIYGNRNDLELGELPASDKSITGIAFRDKNDDNFCYLRQTYTTTGENYLNIFVRNKFASGAPSTSGSVGYAYFGLGLNPDGSQFGKLRGNFVPYTNNSYDLGSSSYQWNNLYAKNYFYNGTAWGLDKDNTWSGTNYYNKLISFLSDFSIGTAPSADKSGGFNFTNGTSGIGLVSANQLTSGTTYILQQAGNRFTNGVLDPNGTWKTVNFQVGLRANGDRFIYTDGAWRNNLSPYPGDNVSLGSSSNKWKTLNGINPGALSIPDGADSGASSSFTPDTTNWPKDGTAFQATMPIVGWLRITIKNVAGNYAFVRRGTAGANLPWQIFADPTFATDFAEVTLNVPVTDVTYTIRINSSGGFTAKVYPCLGNV